VWSRRRQNQQARPAPIAPPMAPPIAPPTNAYTEGSFSIAKAAVGITIMAAHTRTLSFVIFRLSSSRSGIPT
jgi:hypothetical protein